MILGKLELAIMANRSERYIMMYYVDVPSQLELCRPRLPESKHLKLQLEFTPAT